MTAAAAAFADNLASLARVRDALEKRVLRAAANDEEPHADVARVSAAYYDVARAVSDAAEGLRRCEQSVTDERLERNRLAADARKTRASREMAEIRAQAVVRAAETRAAAYVTVAGRRADAARDVARIRAEGGLRAVRTRAAAVLRVARLRAVRGKPALAAVPAHARYEKPARYGRKPDGTPYTHAEFLETLHEAVADIYGVDLREGDETIRPPPAKPPPDG